MPVGEFLARFARAWPPQDWNETPVLVAVSGGADSVALLLALATLSRGTTDNLFVGHFNHQTRGAASEEDEAFVRSLSTSLGVNCHVGRPTEGMQAWDTGDGFEAAARAARYAFLTETARKTGARYVATAHTADDQAETVLHRLVRGTGLAGLAGMPRARLLVPGVTLLRPLLDFRRDELRAYLNQIGQTWREDASNASYDWTRNRIRGELLPHLAETYNPAVVEALVRLSELSREAQEVFDAEAERLLEQCVQDASPDQVILSTAPLRGRPKYLVCELFIALWRRQGWPRQDYGRDEWRRLANLATAESPEEAAITLPGAIVVRGRESRLALRREREPQSQASSG